MALFRCASGSSGGGATITVTYSSDFYGETVTCSHGTKTYSKVATSSGTLEFSVDEEGTWTISSMGFSDTADVVLNYPAELVSIPDGETVLPTDDIEKWLLCADIKDKSYTTLNEVLADSETYNALLGDSNACAYMKRSTTWSTDICASQYAMNLLGQYDTACDALLSDSTWASAIANSTYADSVISTLVPKMTSNTTPSGTAFANSIYNSTYDAYTAFDNNASTFWCSSQAGTVSDIYVGYIFPSGTKVCKASVTFSNSVQSASYKIQISNDTTTGTDGTWTDASSSETSTTSADIILTDTSSNIGFRLFIGAQSIASGYPGGRVATLQFYGRTTSSEKVHGANGESAYILDGGSPVTITDPSTLDAGTYTFYSTVAKNPSDLTADYSKTIRICPNTKEIVVRPDNSLYWWGYNGDMEDCTSANGWTYSGLTLSAPTHNTNSVKCQGIGSTVSAFASAQTYPQKTVHYILTANSTGRYFFSTNKDASSGFNTFNGTYTLPTHISKTSNANTYIGVEGYYDGEGLVELYALWYE